MAKIAQRVAPLERNPVMIVSRDLFRLCQESHVYWSSTGTECRQDEGRDLVQ